jgi:methyltransferase (TIGR00027 family)
VIENLSETARWVAVYRALETERPDAHFRDPFARRLAGERGEVLTRTLPGGGQLAWAIVVRTAVLDEIILDRIQNHGADMVINLAAGLDSRPWRMDLPAGLRWIEVDLPGILEYKAGVMAGEKPRCQYEAIAVDLTSAPQREAVFSRLAAEARNALIITEGLLLYLTAEEVASLATSLHSHRSFRWWLADLASPGLLKQLRTTWEKESGEKAPFQFGPAEGTGFFAKFGWRELSWRSTVVEANRLRRQMKRMWLWPLISRLMPARRLEEIRRFSGYMLLERSAG